MLSEFVHILSKHPARASKRLLCGKYLLVLFKQYRVRSYGSNKDRKKKLLYLWLPKKLENFWKDSGHNRRDTIRLTKCQSLHRECKYCLFIPFKIDPPLSPIFPSIINCRSYPDYNSGGYWLFSTNRYPANALKKPTVRARRERSPIIGLLSPIYLRRFA